MKVKSVYRHLFRSIIHFSRSKYCRNLTTHSCSWAVHTPPQVSPHIAFLFSQREWVAAKSSVQNAALVFHWSDWLTQMQRQLTYLLWCNLPKALQNIIFFNWRIIALQCYVGFCCTTTRISHNCVYIYVCVYIYISPLSCSSLHPHPTPLGHHRYHILIHIYRIQKNSTDEPIYRGKIEMQM